MPNPSVNSYLLAALVTLGTLTTPSEIKAASIAYNFQVDIDSGPLIGNIYTGTLSFDDSGLSGIGTESVFLTGLNFNFEGIPYTLADAPNATVSFLDNIFLGLDYAVDSPPSPTFTSGSLDISEALFSYDLGGSGAAGTGTLTYTSVPESSSWLAFSIPLAYSLGRGGVGRLASKWRK